MVPEQRQQNHDRQGHAEKPKQNSASKTHDFFSALSSESCTTRASRFARADNVRSRRRFRLQAFTHVLQMRRVRRTAASEPCAPARIGLLIGRHRGRPTAAEAKPWQI